MAKRKSALYLSDDGSEQSDNSYSESEISKLSKKKKSNFRNQHKPDNVTDESEDENSSRFKKKTTTRGKKTNARKGKKLLDEVDAAGNIDSNISSGEEFNDGYASDMMGDAEDRERLASMTEKEREQEIFKRVELRDTLKTRFGIEKRIRQARRRELRKEGIYEPPHPSCLNTVTSPKVNWREKQETPITSESVAGRKVDTPIPTKDDDARNQKMKLKTNDVYSDDSCSDSNNDSEHEAKTKDPSIGAETKFESNNTDIEAEGQLNIERISTMEQLSKICLSRHQIEHFHELPFFNKVVVGAFVRILIGQSNGKPVYRLCQVKDVRTDRVYQLGDIQTNKYFILRHAIMERQFKLEHISDHSFNEKEFNKWKESCNTHNITAPSIDQWKNKLRDIKEAWLYDLTWDECEKLIKKNEIFHVPREFSVKRNLYTKNRDLAQSMGDVEKTAELQHELDEIDRQANAIDHLRDTTVNGLKYLHHLYEEQKEQIAAELTAKKAVENSRADTEMMDEISSDEEQLANEMNLPKLADDEFSEFEDDDEMGYDEDDDEYEDEIPRRAYKPLC